MKETYSFKQILFIGFLNLTAYILILIVAVPLLLSLAEGVSGFKEYVLNNSPSSMLLNVFLVFGGTILLMTANVYKESVKQKDTMKKKEEMEKKKDR